MKMTFVTFEVEDSLYEELLAIAEKAGRSIEDYWSERLNRRLHAMFGEMDASDAQ
ncbi:MAG: hypothetical protein AAF311_03415 [Pseudomonadota bacterium]